MRWLLVILLPLPILVLVALGLMLGPLSPPLPQVGSPGRNLFAAVTTGLFGLGYVAVVAFVTVRGVVARARGLDEAMAARGLRPTSPGITGRSYEGEIDGWPVRIDYVQAHRFTPALVNARVGASVPVDVAFAAKGPLLACAGCPRLPVSVPGLPEIGVYAYDEAGVANLLAADGVASLLQSLLNEQRTLGMRQLYLDRGDIWLRAHPSWTVGPEHITAWLDALFSLAEQAVPTA